MAAARGPLPAPQDALRTACAALLLAGQPTARPSGEDPAGTADAALAAATAALWADIRERHTEPHRRYHTLAHLADMLAWLHGAYASPASSSSSSSSPEGHSSKIPPLVLLAVLYHDVIYDPTRGDNEERSAEHAAAVLRRHAVLSRRHVDQGLEAQLIGMILATKSHAPAPPGDALWATTCPGAGTAGRDAAGGAPGATDDSDGSGHGTSLDVLGQPVVDQATRHPSGLEDAPFGCREGADDDPASGSPSSAVVSGGGVAGLRVSYSDCCLFLDADLSVLAASPDVYAAYAEGIRLEYGHVPDDAFREGRAAVLRRFLERPALFHSGRAESLGMDVAARANMRSELRSLCGDVGA